MTRQHGFWLIGKTIFLAVLTLSGCVATTPEKMGRFVEVVVPDNVSKTDARVPFVVMLQGTGGGNIRSELWSGWFNQQGIATVIIDSARARGRNDLDGVASHSLAKDVSVAIDLIKNHPKINPQQYAVMGFSRGGTAALEVGAALEAGQPRPQFVFALYPGLNGGCPNTLGTDTQVHVFYGELDDWGAFNGTRDGCKKMAMSSNNAHFHLLAGAHHGFDDLSSAKWSCCGGYFTSKPNHSATTEAKRIILAAINVAWFSSAKLHN